MPDIIKPSDPHYRTNVAEMQDEMINGCGETPDKYRQYYKDAYGVDTLLTDVQIVMMVGNSEDDDTPGGWAETMRKLEQELTTAE